MIRTLIRKFSPYREKQERPSQNVCDGRFSYCLSYIFYPVSREIGGLCEIDVKIAAYRHDGDYGFLTSIFARRFIEGASNPSAYASGCCSCPPIFNFPFSIFNFLPPPQPDRGCHVGGASNPSAYASGCCSCPPIFNFPLFAPSLPVGAAIIPRHSAGGCCSCSPTQLSTLHTNH